MVESDYWQRRLSRRRPGGGRARRLRRHISNVEFEEGQDGAVTVYSNFNLTELRRGRQDTFAGRTIHRLRWESNGFKIAYKKVVPSTTTTIDNLTFLD